MHCAPRRPLVSWHRPWKKGWSKSPRGSKGSSGRWLSEEIWTCSDVLWKCPLWQCWDSGGWGKFIRVIVGRLAGCSAWVYYNPTAIIHVSRPFKYRIGEKRTVLKSKMIIWNIKAAKSFLLYHLYKRMLQKWLSSYLRPRCVENIRSRQDYR